MEEEIANAKSAQEALRMYQRDKSVDPEEAQLLYNGKSFPKTLPSSVVTTVYECGNPACDEVGFKHKSREKTDRNHLHLRKCSRCQQEQYCSRACQLADWQRHKKDCKKKPTK